MNNNFNIEKALDLTGYVTEERKSRRKSREVNSQEFFTPYEIVKKMCDKIDDETWCDQTKTFLEPCTGNFQFVIYIIWNRIQHGIDWRTALKTCYGVELLQDNIDEGKARVCGMLNEICEDFDEEEAREVMDKNLVCHDFFTWDFENWCELKEEPKKKKKLN